MQYVGPLPGIQVNTVEGLVLDGTGLKLHYVQKSTLSKDSVKLSNGKTVKVVVLPKSQWTAYGLTRYSFARQKLMATGGLDYTRNRNSIRFSGGQTVSQFNPDSPMSPILNSLTTLLLEQNFIKIYEKDFARLDFSTKRENDHFELKADLEYADRRPLKNLENTNPYRWIDWRNRAFTSNSPPNEEIGPIYGGSYSEMPAHQALTIGLSAAWKPWQKYRTKKWQDHLL